MSAACRKRLLRFRMGCHHLPRHEGTFGKIPRLQRVCTLRTSGSLGNKKHLIFLSVLRPVASSVERPEVMQKFMWHDHLIGAAKCVNAHLAKLLFSGGPSNGNQTSDQPSVTGRDGN